MEQRGMTMPDTGTHGPLKKLLVPTDFSKGAELALRRALLLPLAENATIHTIHVLPPNLSATAHAKAMADAKRRLEQAVSGVREQAAGRDVSLIAEVLLGEAFVEIIRCSRSIGTEVIVIGRHGRRPVRDMFIGSTAERVIRKGDVPVLVVNLEAARPYRKPLIATDLEDTAPRVFDLAFRVIGPAVKTVHVVHAFNVPFEGFVAPTLAAGEKSEYRRSFREKAKAGIAALLAQYQDAGIRWKTAVRAGDARSAILTEAIRRRADLIALGTHGRSGVAHALVGSVAEWVISAAPCDVLVSRPVRFSFELP
jgi:nucleotide-binding universal stress UspA family protein